MDDASTKTSLDGNPKDATTSTPTTTENSTSSKPTKRLFADFFVTALAIVVHMF
jgi:hypothetical protein